MAIPSGFGWSPDLKVLRTAPGKYKTDKEALDMKAAAFSGLTVKTYFTDNVIGVNTNPGSEASPLLNVSTALAKTDADVIEIVSKVDATRILWGARGPGAISPTKHVSWRSYDGLPIYCAKPLKPTWVQDSTYSNVYTTTASTGAANTGAVIDLRYAVMFGTDVRRLTEVADKATVATTPGSYYHNTTTGELSVRSADDRNLVGDNYMVPPSTAGSNIALNIAAGATVGNIIYIEDIISVSGTPISATNLTTTTPVRGKIILNRVGLWGSLKGANGLNIIGAYDVYSFDGRGGLNDRDTENVHANTSGICRAMYIRSKVTLRTGYSNTGTDNSNTGHEGCLGIMVDCEYANSDGRVIAWIGQSWALVYGGKAGPSVRTDAAAQSVQAGDTAQIDLYEVDVQPATGGAITLATDGGAFIRAHGMDITTLAKSGNVSSLALAA